MRVCHPVLGSISLVHQKLRVPNADDLGLAMLYAQSGSRDEHLLRDALSGPGGGPVHAVADHRGG